MNDLEYRLRDAYLGATQTVRPDAIRPLDQASATISGPATPTSRSGHRRWMIPLSAAAAVVAIGVTVASVLPNVLAGLRAHNHGRGAAVAGSPATHFLTAISGDGAEITVHNATTGATVTTIQPPGPGLNFNTLATGNGVSYVAAVWPEGACGTSLYRFRLRSDGQPTALTRLGPRDVSQMISQLAVSEDGSTLAFWGATCARAPSDAADDLGVMNLATGSLRQWSLPGPVNVNPLYLSADGRLLEYSVTPSRFAPSGIYLLSASAAPGAATSRSRVLVRAAEFGASAQINSAVMTPDGRTVYFTTSTAGTFSRPWQLRAATVATGSTRLIGRGPTGLPDPLVANPSATQAILIIESQVASDVAAEPSTPVTAAPDQSTSSTAGPIPSTPLTAPPDPSTSSIAKPIPSTASPTAGPIPSASSTPGSSAPGSSAPTATGRELRPVVMRVDLATGKFTVLNEALWQPQDFTYFW